MLNLCHMTRNHVTYIKSFIKTINAPTTSLEPVFRPNVTNPLVMGPLGETCKLMDPYSDMDVFTDELETAIINTLS